MNRTCLSQPTDARSRIAKTVFRPNEAKPIRANLRRVLKNSTLWSMMFFFAIMDYNKTKKQQNCNCTKNLKK